LALGTATWNGEAFRTITGKIFLQNLLMTDWSLNPVVWSAYSEIVAAFALPFFYLLRNRDNRLLDVVFVFFLFALTCLFPAFVGGKHLFVFYLGMIVPTRGRETSVWLRKRVRNPSALFGAGWLGLVLPAMLMPGRPPLVLLGEAAAAFILVGLVVYERRDNPVSRFLRTDFIRWSGLISFSFYLYHLFFLNAFIHLVCRFLSPTFISGNGLLMYLFAVAGTVPVAFMFGHLSYRFIEKPAVLWGRKILPKL
jgi:peptidoglycan/LPS O-acetylase OafA/YrhL